MGLVSQSIGIALGSHCTSTFNGVFVEPSQTSIFVEGKVFVSRLRAILAQSPHSQRSKTMESRLRSKSMTVGGDDLDSRRWSGRKREGEGGGGAVAREEEEGEEERKEKEKTVLENSRSFRFDSNRFDSIQ
ncbi:hypothetical protein JCGZ_00474 [Jatropha curcas]|uniref:Uncharacterized protein n=1 Tax=Jatropha curcas TaxID=180498 RepID=A0A067LE59_JATCU|nr:hypothetical protein JCGZ_00474 [Jatropha curcas]